MLLLFNLVSSLAFVISSVRGCFSYHTYPYSCPLILASVLIPLPITVRVFVFIFITVPVFIPVPIILAVPSLSSLLLSPSLSSYIFLPTSAHILFSLSYIPFPVVVSVLITCLSRIAHIIAFVPILSALYIFFSLTFSCP